MEITGYCDKLSVFPGETIRFMVNCDSAKYQADIVHLIHGDTNPEGPGLKEKLIKTSASGEYPGRKQKVHSGSYVIVPDNPLLQDVEKFSLQAMIWPTTPARGTKGVSKWCEFTGWCMF